MFNLPKDYLDNMQELLKDEYSSYLDSFNNPINYGLRINTNKISVKDFLSINPFNLSPIPWCDDGFYYDINDKPSKHPYYYAGLYYLQEPSAMLPAQVLPIEENDLVLDCCSAPGGKSVKLAAKLNNTGLLISNDISVSRLKAVLKVIEYEGYSNTIIMVEDISKINDWQNSFDKILVDAPCSGEGMFHKDKELIKTWRNDDYYPNLQKQILSSAIDKLKDGGKLVYSTCTFNPKENEEVIEYILDKYPNIKLLPITKYEGFVSGINERCKDCVRLYPHKIKGEGHFVALLEKQGNINKKEIKTTSIENNITYLNDINYSFINGHFINRNNKYYFEKDNDLSLKGKRIIRSGLYLGEEKNNRFEYSFALAMALNNKEYNNILNFDVDDNRVIKYLKGETLDVKDKYVDKDVLVCVDNYPLGWGKVNKGILKNKYPVEYRYQ